MDVFKAMKKRRSIRRFKDERVPYEDLEDLVDFARIAPSAANKQPIEYLIVDDPELEKKVFECTSWAGGIDWEPDEKERPRAYIMILVDEENEWKWDTWDAGLATENICLGAVGKGLGTCILGAIDKECIKSILNMPDSKRLKAAIGIGVPDHEGYVEQIEQDDTGYWMDENGDFHVPKRKLEDILYRNQF